MSVAIDTSSLEAAMNSALENMMKVMKSSIEYQSKTTEVSTYLGQVASRAAKQTPQG